MPSETSGDKTGEVGGPLGPSLTSPTYPNHVSLTSLPLLYGPPFAFKVGHPKSGWGISESAISSFSGI